MSQHTVEKIGGTSMSQFGVMLKNIIIGNRTGDALYQRILVVSAYAGVTDLLLEHKKSGQPGVYAKYAAGSADWEAALAQVRQKLLELNKSFAHLGLDLDRADRFVNERLDGIRDCLRDLRRVCSYGHVQLEEQLPAVREMLAAIGEAHSAFNSVLILKEKGVNAVFVDLTGWMDERNLPFDEKIREAFAAVDLAHELPIVTGYTKCKEGIMGTFDRGYSEITFSKIAVLTQAREGVIHKEFHLSSSDPKLVGADRVKPIGFTSFDVADQLADLGMEAIHPKASKGMENQGIPIRVTNAFDPGHPGTLITKDFRSESPRVEMVTGCRNILAIELWDPDMVGEAGFDYRLLSYFKKHGISYIAKNTNANTITHYVMANAKRLDECLADLKAGFPGADLRVVKVALVAAIGTNMKVPGFLARAATALARANINILAVGHCLRQVNMQFIVEEKSFEGAVRALHAALVEEPVGK